MKKIFTAQVINGRLHIKDEQLFDRYIASLDGIVQITIDRRKTPRSMRQNRYYWGVVIATLLNYQGDVDAGADEDLHRTLCSMFLTDKSYKIPRTKSTSSLSTKEFEDYMEKIRVWAAKELQVTIPLPNEVEI